MLSTVCSYCKGEKKTLVLVGNAQFSVSQKGVQASPVRALINHFAQHVRVVLVDEFNTTKMCGRLECADQSNYSLKLHTSNNVGPKTRKRPSHPTQCELKYKEVKKSCPDFPFTPMMDFRYTSRLPVKLEKSLLQRKEKYQWDDAKYEKMVQHTFSSSLHGLKQCRSCETLYNRDHVAAQNIGQKALDLCLYGKVREPFDRNLYQTCVETQKEREAKQKETNHSKKRKCTTKTQTLLSQKKKKKIEASQEDEIAVVTVEFDDFLE